ncbi:hypothetical protein CIRMBP1315_00434 [Enterococcus cecorum]|uniref:hypothetical protein n=1 Tax=Enterococcus cecorum TaxID=44008 RepID=UPI000642D17E|nr:hypothetical protein [Enterococcus cecorum]KLO67924.1 hypothetical protein AA986_03010 [Enterococcus cecorum]CAI3351462.1 hypothetical protein CIRMBP1315_00434 [Enterococcus cecorum]
MVEDNWKKFKIIGKDRFIAFAGIAHSCLKVVIFALYKQSLPFSSWKKEIEKYIKIIPYSNINSKSMICIGGKDNQVFNISSFSNNPMHVVTDFILDSTDIKYVFLNNVENEVHLGIEFMRIMQKQGAFDYQNVLFGQKELNNLVSNINALYANQNISFIILF